MDRNSVDWHGQFTAIVTPFDKAGKIDELALRRQVEFLIANGVHGIVADGCTGEFWAQTLEERRRVVHIVTDQALRRIRVIGSASTNHTPDVIELTRYFKDIGCDGVMLMPPFMVRPNKEDIFQHFKAVSDAVKLPILLYNVPQDTVNNLTPDLVDRLADLDTVVAIKDSTFDFNIFWQLQCTVGDRIRVMIGPSTLFGAAAVQMGAEGWVDTYSNLWPQLTVELYHEAKKGISPRVIELQKTGTALRRFLLKDGWNMYCAIKAAMNLRGLPGGLPRPPLRPLGEKDIEIMREGLDRLGVPHAKVPRLESAIAAQ
jgi:4-hydroxy-tetrahydrodipicolinate synthase